MIRLPVVFRSKQDTEHELGRLLLLEELLNEAVETGKHVVLSITTSTGTQTFYPRVESTGEVEQS